MDACSDRAQLALSKQSLNKKQFLIEQAELYKNMGPFITITSMVYLIFGSKDTVSYVQDHELLNEDIQYDTIQCAYFTGKI